MAKRLTDKEKGWLFLVVGALILMFIIGLQTTKIRFDGEKNNFSLRVIDWDHKAEVGDTMSIDLKVENTGDNNGSMYVQCSILDRNKYVWAQGLQSIVVLEENQNCVIDEPFTQTAKIDLEEGSMVSTTFTVAVPDTPNADAIIYCDAFEQCWAPGRPSYSSDKAVIQIDIIPSDNESINDNVGDRKANTCDTTTDCEVWLIGKSKCVEGMCIDKEDIEEVGLAEENNIDVPKFDDTTIKAWAKDHKILLWLTGLASLIIGAMFAFATPKQKKPLFGESF